MTVTVELGPGGHSDRPGNHQACTADVSRVEDIVAKAPIACLQTTIARKEPTMLIHQGRLGGQVIANRGR